MLYNQINFKLLCRFIYSKEGLYNMYFPSQCVDPIIYPRVCYGNNQSKKTTALNSNYIQIPNQNYMTGC